MKKTVVNEQLLFLAELQAIDNKIHYIKQLRGDLPDELNALEREQIKTNSQLQEVKLIIHRETVTIEEEKKSIKERKANIEEYEKQKDKVANNREYEAICKAIESFSLDILLSEKRIRNSTSVLESKETLINLYDSKLKDLCEAIKNKKTELKIIIDEQITEENDLTKKKNELTTKVDTELLDHYERVRQNAKNGLAAVKVTKGACGACFMVIPVERQIRVAAQETIEKCEYCGAILLDAPLQEIPEKGYFIYNPVAEAINDNA